MVLQSFDELYVISDLHLGGKKGFQIFNQGDTLAAFIKRLAAPSNRRVGLVLNGDTVDFLAEATDSYLDPKGAVQKLRRIFLEDPAFSCVFSALREFVATPDRRLIVVLGNHDVELALPEATEWLLENISDKKRESRGQVTLSYDGAGFACEVGGKRVFCIHGNDADIWNFVDQRQLRALSLSLNIDQEPPDWDPNAGTRMVIDVMNSIKQSYPIVDLLKPEVEAVVPVLLCLKPDCFKEIARILTVAKYLARDATLRAMGFLSAEQEMKEHPIQEEEVLSDFATRYFDYKATRQITAASLIDNYYKSKEAGGNASPQPSADDRFLGPLDYLPALFSNREGKVEKLRTALEKNLKGDQTFNITYEDHMFSQLDKQAGPNVDFLITGHTHLERAIPRSAPGCFYFNSGTWIRLIRLTDEIVGDSKEFARTYQAFESGSMERLDQIKDLGPSKDQPLVMLRPTVVSIVAKDGETFGELHHVQSNGSLQPVQGTRLPRR